MITILAIDALEYNLVEKFNCKNLKQKEYGKTDISEFTEPRTIVLWSSFLTGKNMEKPILALGNKEMWNFKVKKEDSFLNSFENPLVIDLPGYNYEKEQHEKERKLLKEFFSTDSDKTKKIKEEYNKLSFEHHKKIKQKFLNSLNKDRDLVLGYFSVADVIGHLNFGNNLMMKMIYDDLEDMTGIASKKSDKILVLSDHGMKAIGRFGDHSEYGFWSLSEKIELGKPKITDFYKIIG